MLVLCRLNELWNHNEFRRFLYVCKLVCERSQFNEKEMETFIACIVLSVGGGIVDGNANRHTGR